MEKKGPTYLLDETYYSLVDALADEVQVKFHLFFKDIIKNYEDYIRQNNLEQMKKFSEYGLELLYIGVLFVSYSKKQETPVFNLLSSLCERLENTKEFNEISARFRMWLMYWRKKGNIESDFLVIIKMTEDFIECCKNVLYQYIKEVPEFIRYAETAYKERDDLVFVTRHVNEYYINMVGAQILNQVFREEFKQVDKAYLFLPGCMAAGREQCKAMESKIGYACTACTENCPIHLAEKTSAKYGAETVIVYHSSELYHKKVDSSDIKYGVVGIACVLNLISGGLRAKELGYVPQCVLLDYCGCKQHWDEKGIITDVNRIRLNQILGCEKV